MTPTQASENMEAVMAAATIEFTKVGAKTTLGICTLPNGFEIVETSACVDPADYDQELGESIVLKRITDRVWPLEGYLAQERRFRNSAQRGPE